MPPLAAMPSAPAIATASIPDGDPGTSSSAYPGSSSLPTLMVCDTGERLPTKLVQSLKDFAFIELHWFLPAALLPPTVHSDDTHHSHCHCCGPPQAKRSRRTVADIFTWALCFNRYTAALCSFYPGMLPQMMAYQNTILQAHLQFAGDGWRIYDRAFRIQAASRRITDWTSVDASLYARFVTCSPRRSSVCQFCCSSGHKSSACPWGVDDPTWLDSFPPRSSYGQTQGSSTTTPAAGRGFPICISWNAGSCRYPETCRFRHACSSCGAVGHRSSECRKTPPALKGQPPFHLPQRGPV